MAIKQEEATLILKLYELRCEAEFRKARQWVDTEFNPQSAQEIIDLLESGFSQTAHFRKVLTYWEMAAALVNYGAVDAKLLHATNVEHMRYYAKIEPYILEVREVAGSDFLLELEKLVKSAPDFEKKLAGWRETSKHWFEPSKHDQKVEHGKAAD